MPISKTRTAAARPAGEAIRQSADLLTVLLGQKYPRGLISTLGNSIHQLPELDSSVLSPRLMAWDIVAMWVVAVATGSLNAGSTLRDAGEWFLGGNQSEALTELLMAPELAELQAVLSSNVHGEHAYELLPYFLDPHGPGSRLSVRRDPLTRTARERKRAGGVFYTPEDVASYMVKGCIDSLSDDSPPTILDPSCGTGIFLRVALRELCKKYGDRTAASLAFDCLFGVDVDPWAVDATAFVLLADVLVKDFDCSNSPVEIWSRLMRNISCMNTLLLDPVSFDDGTKDNSPRISLSKVFPRMQGAPTVIVGNPPYADLRSDASAERLVQPFRTLHANRSSASEIYVAFLEQMTRLGNQQRFAGSLVLPLSIASSVGPQFIAARQLIQETPGEWRFAFFDREPQALFGEDVKTRNAIVFWNRDDLSTTSTLASGPMRRWRKDDRESMLSTIGFTPIQNSIQFGIPKLEGSKQAAAMEILDAREDRLGKAIHAIDGIKLIDTFNAADDIVFVGPTAYNFLNIFLRPPASAIGQHKQLSENKLHAIHCATPESALAVFGMLSSHLAYWWWLAYGDGFHVSRGFLADFPFGDSILNGPRVELVSSQGSSLWTEMKPRPTVSVNRSRTSLAYNPLNEPRLRRAIDVEMAATAGIDASFVDELQRCVDCTVTASNANIESLWRLML